jgi:hypothetical protein
MGYPLRMVIEKNFGVLFNAGIKFEIMMHERSTRRSNSTFYELRVP